MGKKEGDNIIVIMMNVNETEVRRSAKMLDKTKQIGLTSGKEVTDVRWGGVRNNYRLF